MPAYSYQAFDQTGKKTKGRLQSPDQLTALQELKQKGMFVTRLEEGKTSIWRREIEFGSKRIPTKDFVPFLRQFATLFRAGVALVESLRILGEQTSNKKLQKVLAEAAAQVARGNQLSEALQEHHALFPPLFLNMVRAGEVTGNLEDVLERLATAVEKEHNTIEKVKSALAYPVVVGIVSVLVTFYLLVSVIPTFVSSLAQVGGTLPLPTRIVLAASGYLIHSWYFFALGALFLVLLFRALVRRPKGRYWVDRLKIRLPIFGPLIQKAAIARCSRTMATLLQSAVPTLQVFSIAANVVGNAVYAKALQQARDSLRAGLSMTVPLRQEKVFPPLVTQMIAIGEQTGSIDTMFGKIADFYEADVERAVDKLRPLIEPLMILLLSGIVGTIVLAAILPIFSIYQNFGQSG